MDIDSISASFDHSRQTDPYSVADFLESNSATISTGDIGESPTSKDYWFGKKYFQYVLAQELMRRTPAGETIQSIDSKSEMVIRQFPYDEAMNNLRSQGIVTSQMSLFSGHCGNSETLMMFIGSIRRQGGPREKLALLTALRNGESGLEYLYRSGEESPNLQEQEQQPVPFNDSNVLVADSSFYTTILKEHGDQVGVIPTYEFKPVTIIPPRFTATLSFDGALFEGQASNKKEAKHMASRRACKSLQLKLR